MKTLKLTTIITGVIVAIISFAAHAEQPESDNSAAERKILTEKLGINKSLELKLIKDYLKEQSKVVVPANKNEVKIFNAQDELIYEGSADSEKAVILKLSADFLMEYNNTSYFRINN